jgi:hypothetical protein
MEKVFYSFSDLVEMGIFKNRPSLDRATKNDGFPPGFLTGVNSRRWNPEDVHHWVERRQAPETQANLEAKHREQIAKREATRLATVAAKKSQAA